MSPVRGPGARMPREQNLRVSLGPVGPGMVSMDGEVALVGLGSSTELWDATVYHNRGELPFVLPGNTALDVDVAPDGRRLASLSAGVVRLWDVVTAKLIGQVRIGAAGSDASW